MAQQTTVLQLVLNELGLENAISTINERIALQKVVCLVQEAGLQLGYSYNWYMRGPYSPSLASDYYQIAADQKGIDQDAAKFTLTAPARAAVKKVEGLLNPPQDVSLDRVGWLELLASIAFLKRRYRLPPEAAKNKIESSKPTLFPYFDNANQALESAGFF